MEDWLSDKDIVMPPSYDEPLPQCMGPKLHPFNGRVADIKFVRLLSSNVEESSNIEDSSNGSRGQSHVFEVTIASQPYALKVFKFYDVDEDYGRLTDEERKVISKKLVCTHMDPFFNECRAFGRIIEAGLNGKIAVKCYGYLAISPKLEYELKKKFSVSEWRRPEHEYKESFSKRQPFRAIVKALLPTGTPPVHSRNIRKALKNLKKMNKLGIYSLDIQARNYISGVLVDLGLAMTEEHYLLYISPPWRVRLYQKEDLEYFDGMVEELSINTWERALPNETYLSKLRSGKELKEDRRLKSAVRTWELIEQTEALEAPNAFRDREMKVTPAKAKSITPNKKNIKSTETGTSNIERRRGKTTRISRSKTTSVSKPRA